MSFDKKLEYLCENFPGAILTLIEGDPSHKSPCDSATIGGIAERAMQYAGAISKELGHDKRLVPLLSDGSEADLGAAVLGIWLAGKSVLAVSASEPLQRAKLLLRQVGAERMFFLDNKHGLEARGGRSLCKLEPASCFSAPSVSFEEGSLVFSICTSGSTGEPKLVHVRWGNLRAWLLNSYEGYLPFRQGCRFLNLFGWGFDAWFEPLLWGILAGMKVENSTPRELMRDGGRWREFRPQIISLTPSQGKFVMSLPYIENWKASLQRTLFGGEVLDYAFARKWSEFFPASTIENTYGPAETTCTVFHHVLDRESLQINLTGAVPIGSPHKHIETKIDEDGVLWVSSDQVTTECRGDGNLWFRTNDISVRNEDDTVTVTGRIDNTVKLHGRRVSLEEIDAAFASCGLRVCALWVQEERMMVGVLLQECTAQQVQDACAAVTSLVLAGAVPRRFFVLNEMALGRTGKLDRAMLLDKVKKGELSELPDGRVN